MKLTFLLACLLFASLSQAFEPKGELIIVHPSRTWDPLAMAKPGIEEMIEKAKKNGIGITMLRHSDQKLFKKPYVYEMGYWTPSKQGEPYPADVDSYYIGRDSDIQVVDSQGGENRLVPASDEITVVGGYLEFCLSHALAHLVANRGKHLKVNIYLPGVFTHLGNERDDFYIFPKPENMSWPHPLNPGFVHLERQIGVFKKCPTARFVDNEMVHFSGDYPSIGSGPTPENMIYSVSCNGKSKEFRELGEDGEHILEINFVTK